MHWMTDSMKKVRKDKQMKTSSDFQLYLLDEMHQLNIDIRIYLQ